MAICVIIGYSFRDEDIVNNIIDALNRNPDLWLIIISPNASEHKIKHFNHTNIASRVVIISKKIEDVLTNRTLNEYIESLKTAIATEDYMWKEQSSSPVRVDSKIQLTIDYYRKIGHEARIQWIEKKLSKRISKKP